MTQPKKDDYQRHVPWWHFVPGLVMIVVMAIILFLLIRQSEITLPTKPVPEMKTISTIVYPSPAPGYSWGMDCDLSGHYTTWYCTPMKVVK